MENKKESKFANKVYSLFMDDINKYEYLLNKFFKGKELHTSHYMFHEMIGAEMADRICTYLKFSNKRKEFVVNMVRNHLKKDCPLKKYDDNAKSELSKKLEEVFLK